MRAMIGLLVVSMVASLAAADVVSNTQYDGWRGWNNHDANYPWMDSWGNSDDWGAMTFCDAVVAEFDRAAIQTAIDNNGGSGNYDAYLTIAINNDADNQAALAIARPVAGVFNIDGFPWGSATCFDTDFELSVKDNVNGDNMFDESFDWSYAVDGDNHNVLSLHVGAAMVDFYMSHTDAQGFFISNANPDHSINPGQRLDTGSWNNFSLEIVPEPVTMGLLLVGGVGCLLRRKR